MPQTLTVRRVSTSALTLTIFALLAPAVLSSCGGSSDSGNTSPTTVTMTATDLTSGKQTQYQTVSNFQPLATSLSDFPQYEDEKTMLDAINAVRQAGGTCPNGQTFKPGLQPIKFEGHLHKSATLYANWLQSNNYQITDTYANHIADGNTPVQRMINAGYLPSKDASFAESLESGASTPEELLSDWQKSPDHCLTLYDGTLNWGSVARSDKMTPTGGYYWVFNIASF